MHAGLRTLAATAALGSTLLGGCTLIDSLAGRDERPAAPETVPGTAGEARAEPRLGAANGAAEENDPAADLPIARPGRELVREVQAALNARGLNAGPADGLSGPNTVRAIRLFKVARRMEVTDDVTPRLLDELGLTRP